MQIRRLVAVPAAAALTVGLLGACNDTAPTEEPGETMSPEESMEDESTEDMEDESTEDMDESTEEPMEDEG